MKKITIEITDQKIDFYFSSSKTKETIIDSQTVETLDKITCSYKYILKNMGQITSLIKNASTRHHPTTIITETYSLTGLIIKLTGNIETIDTIIFKEKNNLSPKIAELILNEELKINNLECYNIDKDTLSKLKEKDINITLKNEITFSSRFMKENNFNTHADLYGKTTIIFNEPPDEYDIEDFQNFLKLNKSLNTIELKQYNTKAFANIVGSLIKNNKKNITINIYENNDNIKSQIKTIKKIKKRYKHCFKYKIIYQKNNLHHYKTLQNIITLILFIAIFLVIIYGLNIFIPK